MRCHLSTFLLLLLLTTTSCINNIDNNNLPSASTLPPSSNTGLQKVVDESAALNEEQQKLSDWATYIHTVLLEELQRVSSHTPPSLPSPSSSPDSSSASSSSLSSSSPPSLSTPEPHSPSLSFSPSSSSPSYSPLFSFLASQTYAKVGKKNGGNKKGGNKGSSGGNKKPGKGKGVNMKTSITPPLLKTVPDDYKPTLVGKVQPDHMFPETEGYAPPNGYFSQTPECDQYMRLWMDDCAFIDFPKSIYHMDPDKMFPPSSANGAQRLPTGNYIGNLLYKERMKNEAEQPEDKLPSGQSPFPAPAATRASKQTGPQAQKTKNNSPAKNNNKAQNKSAPPKKRK